MKLFPLALLAVFGLAGEFGMLPNHSMDVPEDVKGGVLCNATDSIKTACGQVQGGQNCTRNYPKANNQNPGSPDMESQFMWTCTADGCINVEDNRIVSTDCENPNTPPIGE